MKLSLACAALAASVGLSGCDPSAPQAQQEVNQAFAAMCGYLPTLGPAVGQLNGQIQADYATAQTICAAGTPATATASGADILSIYLALEPYFVKAKSATPEMKANVRRLNAALKAHGLT